VCVYKYTINHRENTNYNVNRFITKIYLITIIAFQTKSFNIVLRVVNLFLPEMYKIENLKF